MLRKHPKPDTKVMVPPKLDQFITDFAPQKVDKARDAALKKFSVTCFVQQTRWQICGPISFSRA